MDKNHRDLIVAIKIFFLGFPKSTKSPETSLNLVDVAIEKLLIQSENSTRNYRLIFYYLLKSMIIINQSSMIEYRKKALEYSKKMENILFNNFMKIIDYSVRTSRVSWTGDTIINEGYSLNRNGWCENPYIEDVRSAAYAALDINVSHLDENDTNFLFNVNLKDILERHELFH